LCSEELGDRRGTQVEAERVDVAEQRTRTGTGYGAGGGKEGERAGNDRVPDADAERHEGEQQRIGAGGHADAAMALAVARDTRLELMHRRSQNELLAGAYPANRRRYFGGKRLILQLQIEQGHLHGRCGSRPVHAHRCLQLRRPR